MEIDVSQEIIGRISRVNSFLPAHEKRTWLRSFFVERSGGHAYIGATNAVFGALQYLGISPGADGFVVIDSKVLPLRAWAEADPDQKCKISEFSALSFCTMTGVQGDAAVRNPEAVATLRNWRNWIPEPSSAPGRAMFTDVDGLAALVASSPSGSVVFPKVIDSEKPVILRDMASPDWLGVFMARPSNGLFMDGATRPDWVR